MAMHSNDAHEIDVNDLDHLMGGAHHRPPPEAVDAEEVLVTEQRGNKSPSRNKGMLLGVAAVLGVGAAGMLYLVYSSLPAPPDPQQAAMTLESVVGPMESSADSTPDTTAVLAAVEPSTVTPTEGEAAGALAAADSSALELAPEPLPAVSPQPAPQEAAVASSAQTPPATEGPTPADSALTEQVATLPVVSVAPDRATKDLLAEVDALKKKLAAAERSAAAARARSPDKDATRVMLVEALADGAVLRDASGREIIVANGQHFRVNADRRQVDAL